MDCIVVVVVVVVAFGTAKNVVAMVLLLMLELPTTANWCLVPTTSVDNCRRLGGESNSGVYNTLLGEPFTELSSPSSGSSSRDRGQAIH